MPPEAREVIARMSRSLPNKHRAANPIRQGIPNGGSPEPDRPLSLTASRNRPAPGASSTEGGRDNGAQSKVREPWSGWVREEGTPLLIRCDASDGDAVGGGLCPRRDRAQISEAPQAVKSLHKCALDPFGSTGIRLTLLRQCRMQPKDVLNVPRV